MNYENTYSQSYQDVFVNSIIGDNGTYIEIGAREPKLMSNTYNLEVNSNWKGFSVEIDQTFKPIWAKCVERKNTVFFDNALTLNYEKSAQSLGFTKNIDYLSCDIEPPKNTYLALKTVLDQDFKFKVITFETDRYRNGEEYENKAHELLTNLGYTLGIYDVYFLNKRKEKCIFENWYVSNSIKLVPMSYDEWLVRNNLNI